jgi:ribosome biogenesis GTPase
MAEQDGKYKGVRGQGQRQGMGRLRRAHAQDPARVSGLERQDEESEVFDRLGTLQGSSHAGETLLGRFNRIARSPASQPGEPGAVSGFAGNLINVRTPGGEEHSCTVRQALKKQIAGVRNPIAVGDRVHWIRERETCVINGLEPRRNQLERADSHNRSLIHVFAANIDCLAIVSSLGTPDFKPGLIDRYLVIAAANAIPAAVIINKCDLGEAAAAAAIYRPLGIPVFTTQAARGSGDPGVGQLREHLRGKTCVMAGQSGVGKSSLINALYPALLARIGVVADAGHGRHTTTSARSYLLDDGACLVDTPGVRECGITGLGRLTVGLSYPEIAALHPACRFADCSHLIEPDCAVRAAVADGRIQPSRWESYRSIITEDLASNAGSA